MIIRPKERKTIIASGIFLMLGAFILFVSLFKLSKEHALFESMVKVSTLVENAKNLKSGAFVQYKGIKVGTVEDIEVISLEKIRITIEIRKSVQKWIKTDSYFAFRTQGVLGDRFLEIQGGSEAATPISMGTVLETVEDGKIDQIIDKGEDLLVISGKVLQKIDRLLDSLETQKITNILSHVEKTGKNLETITKNIDPEGIHEFTKSIGPISKNLQSTSKRMVDGPGTVHSLIYDQSAYEDLKNVLGGANRSKVLRFFIREAIKSKNSESKN